MKVRDYRDTDFVNVCDLDRRCFEPGIAYTPEEIEAMLAHVRCVALVAEEGDSLAGFLIAHCEYENRAHIVTIDVEEAQRGKGVGTLLMKEAERRLKRLGAKRIVLEAALANRAALLFYKKLGYTAFRRLKKYYLDRDDAMKMVKVLS